MKITPLDIRKQDFTRRLRGYDPEEVQAFLHTLSAQWDSVLEDSRRQEERLRELETKVRHYERVEEALQEALQTARESARQAMQAAEQKAQQIRHIAENDAERIKRDAEQERMRMRQETQAIHGRRREIVARLRAFLISEMEMLAHFEGEDPIGFIKLMPSEQRRLAAMEEADEQEDDQREIEPSVASAPDRAAPMVAQPPDERDDDAPAEASYDVSAPEEPSGYTSEPEVPAPATEDDDERPEAALGNEESMVERFLRLDQEGETEEAPSHDVWTASAGDEGADTAGQEESDTTASSAENDADSGSAEESASRPGWRQKSLIGLGSAHPQQRTPAETVSAAEEEIARIRRILSQLD